MTKEKRHINFDSAELRFADGEKRTLEGYASVFNKPTDLGRFDEVIERGAFTRAVDEAHDVRALVDHDTGRVIGRTKNRVSSIYPTVSMSAIITYGITYLVGILS